MEFGSRGTGCSEHQAWWEQLAGHLREAKLLSLVHSIFRSKLIAIKLLFQMNQEMPMLLAQECCPECHEFHGFKQQNQILPPWGSQKGVLWGCHGGWVPSDGCVWPFPVPRASLSACLGSCPSSLSKPAPSTQHPAPSRCPAALTQSPPSDHLCETLFAVRQSPPWSWSATVPEAQSLKTFSCRRWFRGL